MDRISFCAKRAKAMGISYGQYMALKNNHKPSAPLKKKGDLLRPCQICGEIFMATRDSQIYCCSGCSERARNRRKSSGRRKKLAWKRAMQEIQKKERAQLQ